MNKPHSFGKLFLMGLPSMLLIVVWLLNGLLLTPAFFTATGQEARVAPEYIPTAALMVSAPGLAIGLLCSGFREWVKAVKHWPGKEG